MKSKRHSKIVELIKTNAIATQEELASALNEAGFNVTQATVSRDIRELNLTKMSVDGKLRYVVLESGNSHMADKFIRVFKEGFVGMDMAQNILVVKTVPGMAMAVCAALDAMQWNEIVGSIAGDDTIMCAVRTVDDTIKLMNKLKNILRK
ncbi:MAG: arginine repressor [Lachnospira sp.]|nr:arginine repressor [Lachnospira sp.]